MSLSGWGTIMPNKLRRSIVKAVTWRVIAFSITFGMAYVFTGDCKISGAIGACESGVKLFSYVLHERIWQHVSWGK